MWLPLLLGVVLSGANAYLLRQLGFAKKTIFYCYAPMMAAIVFWFMTAPDPRFLGAIPGLFFAVSLYIFLRDVMPEENLTRLERLGGLRMLSIGFVVVTVFLNVKLIGLRSLSFTGCLPISPSVIQEHRTDHGAVIYTGVKESQCWNAQLPCAAAFNPRLQLDAINSIPFLTIKGLTRKVFLIKQ